MTPLQSLSAYQQKVLSLAAEGFTDRVIAHRLRRSRSAITAALHLVYTKLNILSIDNTTHPRVRAAIIYHQAKRQEEVRDTLHADTQP